MDAEILTVGTELVLGFTINGNAAVMGGLLSAAGVRVRRTAVVTDEPALIEDAVRAAMDRSGTVIVCGGLGPTKDDLTREAVARVFGKPLRRDPAIVERPARLVPRARHPGDAPKPISSRPTCPKARRYSRMRWARRPASGSRKTGNWPSSSPASPRSFGRSWKRKSSRG